MGFSRVSTRCWGAGIAATVVLACALLASFGTARADTASELDQARQQVALAQTEANSLAAELSAAQARAEQIQDGIERLQGQIDDARVRIRDLEILMRDRAVAAYVKGGADDSFGAVAVHEESDGSGATQPTPRAREPEGRPCRRRARLDA